MARISPGEAQAAAQQEGLAEGAAVGEGGKLQLHGVNAGQRNLARVGVVGQGQGAWPPRPLKLLGP
jgi:hypothetical protein